MKRMLLLAIGLVSFGLGSIGVILPVLPTTPFLLLSAYCFARSSKRFDVWLKQSRLYRIYIADYMKNRMIPTKRKWKILFNIYLMMSFSIYFAPLLPVKVGLTILTAGITFYLFAVIPSRPEKNPVLDYKQKNKHQTESV